MAKNEKILVAVDGSRCSDLAVSGAMGMAKAYGSKLLLIHAVDVNPEYLSMAPALEDKLEKEAADLLAGIMEKVEKEGIACETILSLCCPAHESIVREAAQREVDLIVMGTHGRSGAKKMFMGSVAQQVIAHTPCPVLVVPESTN